MAKYNQIVFLIFFSFILQQCKLNLQIDANISEEDIKTANELLNSLGNNNNTPLTETEAPAMNSPIGEYNSSGCTAANIKEFLKLSGLFKVYQHQSTNPMIGFSCKGRFYQLNTENIYPWSSLLNKKFDYCYMDVWTNKTTDNDQRSQYKPLKISRISCHKDNKVIIDIPELKKVNDQ